MNPIREQIELLTRRHFFGRTGLCLGTAAPVELCSLEQRIERRGRRRRFTSRDRRSAGPAAFPAQGQAGDLPPHERRPVADGSLRL